MRAHFLSCQWSRSSRSNILPTISVLKPRSSGSNHLYVEGHSFSKVGFQTASSQTSFASMRIRRGYLLDCSINHFNVTLPRPIIAKGPHSLYALFPPVQNFCRFQDERYAIFGTTKGWRYSRWESALAWSAKSLTNRSCCGS